jgi:predicted outer membrane protein
MTPRASARAGVVLAHALALALCGCAHEPATAAQPASIGALVGPGPAGAEKQAPASNSSSSSSSREDEDSEDPVVSAAATPAGGEPSSGPAETGNAQSPPAHDGTAVGPQLTNEQILQIARTSNAEQIRQAEIAHRRARDWRVHKLAATVLRQRRAEDTKGDALARKRSLTGEPSPQSVNLEERATRTSKALQAQYGAEFDRSYLDAQVSEHEALLDMLTQTLIPSSTSSELTAYLRDLKASDESELAMARALRAELEK